jgi:hypothetical protein
MPFTPLLADGLLKEPAVKAALDDHQSEFVSELWLLNNQV